MNQPIKFVSPERESVWFISPLRKPLTEDEVRRIWRGLDPKGRKA